MINLLLLFPLVACFILFLFKNRILNNIMLNTYALVHFIISGFLFFNIDLFPKWQTWKFFAIDDTNKLFLMLMSIVFLAVALYNNGYLKNDISLTRKIRHYTYMIIFYFFV